MAVTHNKEGWPAVAASVINEGAAVAYASGGVDFGVHPATALSVNPIAGIAEATAASAGLAVRVISRGIAKGIAATTIVAGQRVTAGSINGALGPYVASPATAGNAVRYGVGFSLQDAAAGERFSVDVRPFQTL